jgi:hypothetical protein
MANETKYDKLSDESAKGATRDLACNPEDSIYVAPQAITVEKLKKFAPKGTSKEALENVVEMINNVGKDHLLEDIFAENVLSYASLASGSGVGLEQVVRAVKYCSLKRLKGMTNIKAWAITFPDRYDKLTGEKRYADSHASEYNSSPLVAKIDEQMMISDGVKFWHYRYASIQKQYELMNGIAAGEDSDGNPLRVSPHVQHLAANALYNMTKMPEKAKVEVDVKINQGSIIDEYEKAIGMMAHAKMAAIEQGNNMFDIINSPVRATIDNARTRDVESVIDVDTDDE